MSHHSSAASSGAPRECLPSAPPAAGSNRIILFDVDGTLTAPRKVVEPAMLDLLKALRSKGKIGVVGGSDIAKQREQLGEHVLEMFDYVFSENGMMAFRGTELIATTSIKDHLGEERLKAFLNFTLSYLATIDIPVKRGTFIEYRNGMINISPIGRNCAQKERDDFEAYDAIHGVRKAMVTALSERFHDFGLKYSIGGQISFDVFPIGWDKTFCLKYVQADGISDIHFFGDKTFSGGNDYEIFESPLTHGHTTTGPLDTIEQCTALFLS